MPTPPILSNKHYAEPSVLTAENLLREARRQKSVAQMRVPRICVLDPDGDVVYAFAEAKRNAVVCLAHVTNRMARSEVDFEKGIAGGSHDALRMIALIARAWMSH